MARAADIIYLARTRRGFTQSELADLSGIGQPKISTYERGRVEPSFEVVERLVGHCGLRLVVRLEDNTSPPLPETPWLRTLHAVQWALARSTNYFGLLELRLEVRPFRPIPRLFARTRRTNSSVWVADYLARTVGRVEVIDLASVPSGELAAIRASSVPVSIGFDGPLLRETRDHPPRPDDRWYATTIVGTTAATLHGRPPLKTEVGSRRRVEFLWAVKERERHEQATRRRRADRDRLWHELDASSKKPVRKR